MMIDKTLFQAFGLIIQTYGVILIGLLVGVFSARSLSVGDRGSLALLLLIAQFCSRLGSIGFEQIIQRTGPKGRIGIFYFSGLLGGVLTLPIAMLGVYSVHVSLIYAPILSILAGAISVLRVNISFLIFREKLRELSIFNLSQTIFQLILYIIVFQSRNLLYFFWAWILNVFIFSSISIIIIHRNGELILDDNFKSLSPIKKLCLTLKLWKEGMNYSGVAIPEMALTFCIELPIVRHILGENQAGLYAISNTLTGIYFQMFAAISAIIAKRKGSFPRIIVYFVLSILCVVIIVISGSLISLLFGQKYIGAVDFIKIMLPVTLLLGIARIEQMKSMFTAPTSYQLGSTLLLITSIILGILIKPQYLIFYIAGCYTLYAVYNLLSVARGGRLEQ